MQSISQIVIRNTGTITRHDLGVTPNPTVLFRRNDVTARQ